MEMCPSLLTLEKRTSGQSLVQELTPNPIGTNSSFSTPLFVKLYIKIDFFLMYILMIVNTCTDLCNHDHNQNKEQFHHLPPKSSTCFPFRLESSLSLSTTDLFCIPIVLSFWECHETRVMQYIIFRYWLLALSIILLRFIWVVECISNFIFLSWVLLYGYTTTDLFICWGISRLFLGFGSI